MSKERTRCQLELKNEVVIGDLGFKPGHKGAQRYKIRVEPGQWSASVLVGYYVRLGLTPYSFTCSHESWGKNTPEELDQRPTRRQDLMIHTPSGLVGAAVCLDSEQVILAPTDWNGLLLEQNSSVSCSAPETCRVSLYLEGDVASFCLVDFLTRLPDMSAPDYHAVVDALAQGRVNPLALVDIAGQYILDNKEAPLGLAPPFLQRLCSNPTTKAALQEEAYRMVNGVDILTRLEEELGPSANGS